MRKLYTVLLLRITTWSDLLNNTIIQLDQFWRIFIQLKLRKPIGMQKSKLDIGLHSATCFKVIVLENLMLKAILKIDRYEKI
jgi:hypothetical protein